ncbi:MAG: right-handed parallel beta-helix repeat-containing protein [Anaerolineae bacterium]
MTHHYRSSRLNRVAAAVAAATLALALSLVLLRLEALAGWAVSGARGCGLFIEAVRNAQNGDTIVPMLPERTSDGAVITKSITIHGGWFPPQAGCSTENKVFTDTADLLAAGFTYHAPLSRSVLVYDRGPVITIDPAVVTLTVQHMSFKQLAVTNTVGGGITGVISDGAEVRLENVMLAGSAVLSRGGGLYLELRGGSRLVISDSFIMSNTAGISGGGFEIHLFDGSELVIDNTQVSSNTAAGGGGGGQIVVHSGAVSITNSAFFDNQAAAGSSLSIEGAGGGPATVRLNGNTFNGNTLPGAGELFAGGGLLLSGNNLHTVFLPAVLNNVPFARITGITLNGDTYDVAFKTIGFTAEYLPGKRHLHFFFSNVPPSEAGVPGSGPWKLYPAQQGDPAPSPFTGYKQSDNTAGASQMCVLIANFDHTVQQGTGNCVALP